MSQPAAAVTVVAAAPSRLTGTPTTRWTGCGGSSTAVPGTSGAAKNGAQYATGTAAAKNRAVPRSPAADQIDQMLTDDSAVAIASAVTPWKRACAGQRSLKMCESFQSAATGAAAVITFRERQQAAAEHAPAVGRHAKIPRGTVMETTQFGRSTVSLIFRSPATLQMA